jgi:hypothetical protein
MIDPEQVPPVADEELLARYVTHKRQFRRSDYTIKQDQKAIALKLAAAAGKPVAAPGLGQ